MYYLDDTVVQVYCSFFYDHVQLHELVIVHMVSRYTGYYYYYYYQMKDCEQLL